MATGNVSNYYESYYKFLNPNFSIEWYSDLMWNDLGSIFEDIPKDAKILDLGSGVGQFLKVLQLKGYTNLTGVEWDKGQHDAAAQYVPNAILHNEDIFKFLETSSEKYDCITLIDVIEHLPKERVINFLELARKNLKPNGIFIMRTPNADSTVIATRFRYIDFTHQFILNQESMSTILREAGFTDFRFLPSYIPRKGIKGLFFKIVQQIGDGLLRLYMFTYIHEAAKRMILTPNFITVVKAPHETR